MGFGRSILVLLPFLDCRIRNSKSQQFRKLRHGQREVDSLLAEVFSEGRWSSRVLPQSLKVYGFGGFPCLDLAVVNTQQAESGRSKGLYPSLCARKLKAKSACSCRRTTQPRPP